MASGVTDVVPNAERESVKAISLVLGQEKEPGRKRTKRAIESWSWLSLITDERQQRAMSPSENLFAAGRA